MFKRIVIKLSGEALAGDSGQNYDRVTISRIVDEIKTIVLKGTQVSLVVGGGNLWRGRDVWHDGKYAMDGARADQIGMMATVMNAVFLSAAFKQVGTDAAVMTPFPIGGITEQFSKDRAIKYLEGNTVLIFAAGTGLPFFSTDTITAVRAAELEADACLFAKNVDGIYDSDPRKNPDAKKYDVVTYKEIISKNLQAIDIAAISVLEQQKVKSFVFGLDEPGSIINAAAGAGKSGTLVTY